MPGQTLWERTKRGSLAGFDRVRAVADKLGSPGMRPYTRVGSETFWPTTLDKEALKAATILRSWCRDGVDDEETRDAADGSRHTVRVVKKIPPEVIRNAHGIAVFSAMRAGLWLSGAGGSGVLVARTQSGAWCPPSAIMAHTTTVTFLPGVDLYDCVLILNTPEAVSTFSTLRCALDDDLWPAVGPVSTGDLVESDVHARGAPVFTYLRSRGYYAGVPVDGTEIIERVDENERFYGADLAVADILAGRAPHPMPSDQYALSVLDATLRSAEGNLPLADERLIPLEAAPSDHEIYAGPMEQELNHHHRRTHSRQKSTASSTVDDGTNTPPSASSLFGVPTAQDPDPFGVRALESKGLAIREAGTQRRFSSDQFDFSPSPSSPIYPVFARLSVDAHSPPALSNGTLSSGGGGIRRPSWRGTMQTLGAFSGFANGVGRERAGSNASSGRDRAGSITSAPWSMAYVNASPPPASPVTRSPVSDMATQTDFSEGLHPPALPPRPMVIHDIPEEAASEGVMSRSPSGNVPTVDDKVMENRSPPSVDLADHEISPTTRPVVMDETTEAQMPSLDLKLDESNTDDDVTSHRDYFSMDRSGSPVDNGFSTPDYGIMDRRSSQFDSDAVSIHDSAVMDKTQSQADEDKFSIPDYNALIDSESEVDDDADRTILADGASDAYHNSVSSTDHPTIAVSSTNEAPTSPSSAYTSPPSAATSPSLSQAVLSPLDDDTYAPPTLSPSLNTDRYSSAPVIHAATTATAITSGAAIVPAATTTAAKAPPPTATAAKATSATPVTVSRARIVTVPKRVAPALPPRNPDRAARARNGGASLPDTPRMSLEGERSSSSVNAGEEEKVVESETASLAAATPPAEERDGHADITTSTEPETKSNEDESEKETTPIAPPLRSPLRARHPRFPLPGSPVQKAMDSASGPPTPVSGSPVLSPTAVAAVREREASRERSRERSRGRKAGLVVVDALEAGRRTGGREGRSMSPVPRVDGRVAGMV